ncbi:hypothetical protein TSUD_146770 [Trifolium subterraneum]|uniref:Multiple C2 domain-containing protein n=1 Tax=Trifolium subterraneum TaxID=3900 RepID=A0A2Z6N8J1_TRISU|nr:hypothetical protein TSUD_146770 [Trifolium subterraneum]
MRTFFVEVLGAKDLFASDGKGSCTPYVRKYVLSPASVSGKIELKLYYQDVGEQAKEVEPEIDDDTQSMAYADTDIDIEPPTSPEHELVHPEPQQIQVYPEPQQIQVCANPMAYHKPKQLRLGLNPLVRWIEDTRGWKNPMATIIVHVLLVMYAWLPDLIVPFLVLILYLVPFKMVAMVGGFYYLRHPILRKQTYSPQRLNVGVNPLVQWIDDTRGWKNPTATIFTHVLLIMNVLYSGVIVPVLGLYVMFIATWSNRFRVRESVQMVVTSFRNNPRAIGILGFLCLVAVLILYLVPFKMVVMVNGFYYLRHPILRYRLHQLLRRFG